MKTKNHQASVLIISMIVLSMILVTALTISLSTLRNRKTSLGSSKSSIAYQNAETGVESVMDKVVNGGYSTVGNFCADSAAVATLIGTYYTAELKKTDGTVIDCGGSFNSLDISEVAIIKSTGKDPGDQAKRAIEAAVATGGGGSYTHYCVKGPNSGNGSLPSGTLNVSPTCPDTVTIGTQGPCDSGYKVTKDLGRWGYCSYNGAFFFLPPGGNCNTGYYWGKIGNAYVCSS